MLDFIEPAESPVLVSLIQKTWPFIAALKMRRLELHVDNDVYAAFRQLKNQRTIICPNHPSQEDGLVLFALSGLMGERFSYLTAREMFGLSGSFQAKWLQKLGCYSVQRGTADISAFKQSCNLLNRGKNKVVIFPEGEISYKNSLLRQFESGPELIAISSLYELRQAQVEDNVFILPLSLMYRFSRDIRRHLLLVMRQVEQKLKIKHTDEPFKERLRNAYERLLERTERPKTQATLKERLRSLCEMRILEFERFLGLNHPVDIGHVRRIHLLMNALAEIDCSNSSAAARDPGSPSHEVLNAHYLNLMRLVGFMAVSDHNFDHDLTQEEGAELLRLLAEEVCTGLTVRKPEIVHVGAAKPINVDRFLPAERAERKRSVQLLKQELEHRISARLGLLEQSFAANLFQQPLPEKTA